VPCSVVCISHATGAGGDQVGRLVAERLGFRYVDEQIVSQAAAKAGVDTGAVADAERRKSLVSRMLEMLGQSGGEGWAVGGGAHLGADELGDEELRTLIREAIEQTAANGRAVIVAHAASHALPPGPEVLRVFVTASPQIRAQRISASDNLDQPAAARAVDEADKARRDYLKRFYDVGEELPVHYDLVVNTDLLPVAQAAELVAIAAARLTGSREDV
jgi:cytidylate kinase